MGLTVNAIKVKRKENEFDLFETILNAIKKSDSVIKNGDVLVISSKFVSNAQGRILSLDSVKTSSESMLLSKKYRMKPALAEIILRESDEILGGISGFVISSSDKIIAPNAGIDKSNVSQGNIILYPYDPYQVAEQIRRKFFLKLSILIGVILVDSRLMPARVGTTGVAIACAGIEPVSDLRAQKDLDGNSLKVTFQAVVDNLASIANHKMGEASESKPIAIIKNSGAKLTNRKINPDEVAISHDQCVYVRGLKNT